MIEYAINYPLLPVVFISLLAMLIGSEIAKKFRKYTEVTIPEAVTMMNNDKLIILDVRDVKERQDGYINKDKNIPVSQVKAKIGTLDKNRPILVYCRSGMRSNSIAQMLGKAEFKTYSLKGGFLEWTKLNMPIVKK